MAKTIADLQAAMKRIADDDRYVYGKWSGAGNNAAAYPSDGFHLDCATAVSTAVREALEGKVSRRVLITYSWPNNDGSENFDYYLRSNGFTRYPYDCQKALNSGYEVVIVIGTQHMWAWYSTSQDLQFEANDSRPNTIDIHKRIPYSDAKYMYFPTGWAKGKTASAGVNNGMMTSEEWVRKMEVIADFPNSAYRNSYPYNLLYWDGIRWWGDCVNIQKALFNGRDVDNPGKGTYQSNLSKTGDCTEWELLQQCSDISQDFGKLKAGEPRILYKDGHIGAYLGKEKQIAKGIVNVVECTPAWEDGIQYSYVDSQGRRYSYKGAAQASAWTHHGKPTKWVSYPAGTTATAPTGTVNKTLSPKDQQVTYQMKRFAECFIHDIVLSYGSNLHECVKYVQEYLQYYGWYTGDIDGDWGDMTEAAVRAWQKANGLVVDGIIASVSLEFMSKY